MVCLLLLAALAGRVAAAPSGPVISVDFGAKGNAANGRATGILNTFCNDSVHGTGHAASRNVPLSQLTPLHLRNYRGCATYADEGVPQLLKQIGV